MADDPTITIDDIRAAGHCPAGARDWFRANNLDFRAFLQSGGCSASTLLAVEDNALAVQVVQRKSERERG